MRSLRCRHHPPPDARHLDSRVQRVPLGVQPWDTVIVAVGSLGAYFWGVRAGTAYLKGHHRLLAVLQSRVGDDTDILPKIQPDS